MALAREVMPQDMTPLLVSLDFPSSLESWPGEDHDFHISDGETGQEGEGIGSPTPCQARPLVPPLTTWFGPLLSFFSLGLMLVGMLQLDF